MPGAGLAQSVQFLTRDWTTGRRKKNVNILIVIVG
jgi:hypothetical protein